jgi:hypothetical protein
MGLVEGGEDDTVGKATGDTAVALETMQEACDEGVSTTDWVDLERTASRHAESKHRLLDGDEVEASFCCGGTGGPLHLDLQALCHIVAGYCLM